MKLSAWTNAFFLLLVSCQLLTSYGFSVAQRQLRLLKATTRNSEETKDANPDINNSPTQPHPPVVVGVVAPLVYKGPYPCLGLRFPHLHAKDALVADKGVELDFLVDTGANVNSITAALVETYRLPKLAVDVPKPLATAGMGGALDPGDYYVLGDCGLAGLPSGQRDAIFMTNTTAAVLPRGPMDTDGLLGSSFVASFAGVEFDWYGTDGDPPTFCFYFGTQLPQGPGSVTQDMVQVPLQSFFQLSTVEITVNGVVLKAMIDTGSPITVMSEEAAQRVGISTVSGGVIRGPTGEKPHKELHHQKVGDPILHMGGVDGRPISVLRSSADVHIDVGGASLGDGPVYAGNIPALSFFQSIPTELMKMSDNNPDDAPVAILGLDWLKRAYRIIMSTRNANGGALWIEELDETKKIYEP